MKNMSQYKVEMPVQDPLVRNKNFEEVALGYTPEMAMEEAARCLGCKHRPCVEGCPVSVQIPDFIARVAEGDFAGCVRSCLPSGEPVREPVCPGHQGRTGGNRTAGAVRGGLGPGKPRR